GPAPQESLHADTRPQAGAARCSRSHQAGNAPGSQHTRCALVPAPDAGLRPRTCRSAAAASRTDRSDGPTGVAGIAAKARPSFLRGSLGGEHTPEADSRVASRVPVADAEDRSVP